MKHLPEPKPYPRSSRLPDPAPDSGTALIGAALAILVETLLT